MNPVPAPAQSTPLQPATADIDATTGTGSSMLGLGLDAGGTHTRWALADAAGRVCGEGVVAAMSGQQLASPEGLQALASALHELVQAVSACVRQRHPHVGQPERLQAGPPERTQAGPPERTQAGPPERTHAGPPERTQAAPLACLRALVAGITGFDAQAMPQWRTLAAQALHLPADRVRALSDIELACAAAFAPGQGVVLIAGTGSIAAHVDAQGVLHRAGGRGAVIDDAGGGHWIARQALQQIWRAEDEAPGSWQVSPLARQVFAHIGGSDWAHTRQWVYGATRGELGKLALAVAQAADSDAAAAALLARAGQELARLVMALQHRVGTQAVAITGRVFELHPLVEASLRQALPAQLMVQRLLTPTHHAAARFAGTALPPGAGRDNGATDRRTTP